MKIMALTYQAKKAFDGIVFIILFMQDVLISMWIDVIVNVWMFAVRSAYLLSHLVGPILSNPTSETPPKWV